jgi:UDP-N-acetylglucosamine acyltransferase
VAIHPTAIVDRRAELDATVDVGPYAIVEAGSQLGPGVRLHAHAFIATGVTLAAGVQVYPFAVVGHHPQDLAWKQTPSYVTVGENTVIRESVTIHRGTPPESTTSIGRRCFLMACSHVGHNSAVGDDVKLANAALLAGWVQIGSGAFVSGGAVVHQFVRVGELVMLGGLCRATQDVPPYMLVFPHGVVGVNLIGLRRAGLAPAQRAEAQMAHRLLYRSGRPMKASLEDLAARVQTDVGRRIVEFMQAPSKRGYLRLRRAGEVFGVDEVS